VSIGIGASANQSRHTRDQVDSDAIAIGSGSCNNISIATCGHIGGLFSSRITIADRYRRQHKRLQYCHGRSGSKLAKYKHCNCMARSIALPANHRGLTSCWINVQDYRASLASETTVHSSSAIFGPRGQTIYCANHEGAITVVNTDDLSV
jgi:hypothetical protein